MKFNNKFIQRIVDYAKPVILPILVAVIPSLYHYGDNVRNLTLSNLWRILIINIVLALVFCFIIAWFSKFQMTKTANATVVFLIFFNTYGLAYRHLSDAVVVRIRHYNLLPLTIMLAIYTIWAVAKLKESVQVNVWKNLVLVSSIMILLNLAKIVPVEAKRWGDNTVVTAQAKNSQISLDKKHPDIYYILFDEFAGFQAMREYWHYKDVDDFVHFLKSRGFFIAEASHGSSISTLHEMATRLNYQNYSFDTSQETYFNDISDNRVMRYLKSLGYNTVVFDERKLAIASIESIHADYVYEFRSASIPTSESGLYVFGLYIDDFGQLVMDNTMLYVLSDIYKNNNPSITQHTAMIHFTVENVSSPDIPSPKFVYVHLLLPHPPFIFDRDGGIVNEDHFRDWNYYIDSYIFSIKVAKTMVNEILNNADPANPPVIILQSDHGARNISSDGQDSVTLQNYPDDFKKLIMFTLYMPGYDYSGLPQDIKPVNTFPIVFNYLFDTGIPLIK